MKNVLKKTAGMMKKIHDAFATPDYITYTRPAIRVYPSAGGYGIR